MKVMDKLDFTKEWIFSKKEKNTEKTVRLPHDAMIEEERDANAPSGSAGAFFPGGIYTYKKNFFVPEDWKAKTILVEFEGIYKDAEIYMNGRKIAENSYGYTPFAIHLENHFIFNEDNEITVVVDNSQHPNSRWYTGSGIHRPVWLYIGEKEHIAYQGVKITTLSHNPARIQVETQHSGNEVKVEIEYQGNKIAEASGDTIVFDLPEAKLWDEESPNLYQCIVKLMKNNQVVDQVIENFGIRTVEWSNKGLFINGKETLLRGGCVHSDNGILGAVSYSESEDRRVRIMKKAGYNAIRSSHNLASKSMLEACDKHGMYIVDETWDMWYSYKSKYDYASKFMKHYKDDIQKMIERDYNHPSVIMYSIGNEVTEPAQAKGVELMKEMTSYLHELDYTRPVTCGLNLWLLYQSSKGKNVYGNDSNNPKNEKKNKEMNSTVFNMIASKVGTKINKGAKSKKAEQVINPALDVLDIAGYNYSSGRYPLDGNRIIMGSETYPQDIYKNWKMVKEYPYLIGDFVWTSWDYLGEVGLGSWAYSEDGARFDKPFPWLLADTGTIDILGNIGAQADYAAIIWEQKKGPAIHVRPVNHANEEPKKMVWRGTNAMPSWSWRNCEGNNAFIEIYTKAYRVELFLDNQLMGKKRVKEAKAYFKVRYQPGTLTAIAYDKQGNELSRSNLTSATGKITLSLVAEKMIAKKDELIYIDVSLVGENRMVESNDDRLLKVTVTGGELLAFGSANPRTEEEYHRGEFTTYYGRAQAVVRSNQEGTMQVMVEDNGIDLEKEVLEIKITEEE